MIEFAWLWVALLWPLPALVRWLTPRLPALQAPLQMAWIPELNQQQPQPYDSRTNLIVAAIIWSLLVVAAMRPQWLGEPITVHNEAREMMLAIDLSGSMEIADMDINGRQIDRLTMVKHVMNDFIARRAGDRLGLILFADTAYVQAPMTFDTNTVQQLLNESTLRLVGERTAIGDAIALSVKRFIDRGETNKIIILLTDGQNTAGSITPEQALQLARYYDVKIYAIGVGAEEVIVDGFFGQRRVNPSRDLDENMLRSLARETGGEYFRARSTEELERIYEKLDEYEPIADDTKTLRPHIELFFWPLGFACGLAILCLLIRVFRGQRG